MRSAGASRLSGDGGVKWLFRAAARPARTPSAVLLNLVLPEQSGFSVLAELRAAPATAHVPVIVVSGQPQVLRDAVIRADAVIAKPFALDTLLAEVSRSRRNALPIAVHEVTHP